MPNSFSSLLTAGKLSRKKERDNHAIERRENTAKMSGFYILYAFLSLSGAGVLT
jgi:hypothetical protein